MRIPFTLSVCLLCGSAASVAAQPTGEAYVVGGAGGWRSGRAAGAMLGGAAGGEWLPAPPIGIGGEAAVYTTPRGGLLLGFSADARVRLAHGSATRRVTPFAGGGYSRLVSFESSANAVNVSVGVDIRPHAGRALRLECRDVIRPGVASVAHYWLVRAGVVFR